MRPRIAPLTIRTAPRATRERRVCLRGVKPAISSKKYERIQIDPNAIRRVGILFSEIRSSRSKIQSPFGVQVCERPALPTFEVHRRTTHVSAFAVRWNAVLRTLLLPVDERTHGFYPEDRLHFDFGQVSHALMIAPFLGEATQTISISKQKECRDFVPPL